jgi:hypothetical protein
MWWVQWLVHVFILLVDIAVLLVEASPTHDA